MIPPSSNTPAPTDQGPPVPVVAAAPDVTAHRIADWLRGIRAWARIMLVSQRTGWIAGGFILALIVGGFADFFLRAPMQLRLTGLVFAAGALGWFILHFLLPALRFRPRLTEIALRVEKSKAGGDAHIRGLLASALELGRSHDALPAPALANPVIAQAADRLTAIRAREVFSIRATLRGIGVGVAAVLLLVGLSISWPQHTRIGLARMLWPIGSAEWPKRTEIADAMSVEFHPMGSPLEFRAGLIRSDREPDRTNIAAHYRILTGGSSGPEHTALLTAQPQSIEATLPDGTVEHRTLFERLIEPTGLTPGHPASRTEASTAKTELEYWFESDDDSTPHKKVLLVEPPTVLRAIAQIALPEYASKILGAGASGPQKTDLGPGSDDRAAPAPILAGSRISVAFELNKPITLPANIDAGSDSGAAWIQSTLGPEALTLFRAPAGGGPSPGATIKADGRTWTLSWQHWDSLRLIVKPTDDYKITASEDAVFRFDALKDNPPTASVTIPLEDKSVLPTAVVEIAGEGRDDVALSWVALERQLARKNASSEGAVPEPSGERTELIRLTAEQAAALDVPSDNPQSEIPNPKSVKRILTTQSLDLSSIPDLKPGDELWITALAADAYELAGQKHEAVRSSVRKLRILSREQLVEQIWSELGTLRRTVIKIDQDQTDIAKVRPPAGPAGSDAASRTERAQAGLTERLSRQNQAVQRLQTRIKENGLTDQGLSEVMKQGSEALARAGGKSAEASKNLGDASREESKPEAKAEAGTPELEQSAAAQQGVRDELSRLIDMLDQGEDSFASKRSVERMLEQQKSLLDRTNTEGRQTAGKVPDELSAGQRDALDKISQEQKALADQLRESVKKMQERQAKVREKDPAAAEAMAQAAAQALRDQTAERMDDASKDAEANQTSSAQQQQQQAIQSLEQMLDKMQKAQSNKDEVLKRKLATLIESLNALIKVQEISIGALKEVAPKGPADIAALERPMILQHENTLGVLEQAASAPELSRAADFIEKAAEFMAMSVPELREAKAEPALEHEDSALDKLKEARDLAQKLDEKASERQNDAKRAELREKYLAALKTQLGLRDNTEGLVGAEANRRTKAQARALGEEQNTLKGGIDKIREETRAVSDAKVFNFAHDRLDALMSSSASTLLEGAASASSVRAQTSAARLLKSLADALDDKKKDDDAFRENDKGGGGSGQGGEEKENPVVPDTAELVLLRMMQQEALDLSRNAADDPKRDPALINDAAALQGDLSKQATGFLKKVSDRSKGAAPSKPGPLPTPDAKPANDDKPEGEGEKP